MNNLENILRDKISCKSVWFMRQAGRYLPELNSDLSSKITLQPIKRFDVDSAIIFSDILMTPYALGQSVNLTKNQGPKLSNFDLETFLDNDEKNFSKKLNPVYEAINITRKKLSKKKSLICFVGAPWTLLIYMLGVKKGEAGLDLKKIKNKILEKLIEYLCIHIDNQINAGADVVQIFDSWAGLVPIKNLKYYCYIPNAKIVDFCKKKKIPNICFPRGIKEKYEDFNNLVKPDGINIDSEIDPEWAKKNLSDVVLQGGLDPKVLLKTEEELEKAATKYIRVFKDIPYIFNLGHGLLPETDPDKVKKLIKLYRDS